MIKRNLKARIISTGSYLPEHVLGDEEIVRRYGLDISPRVLHRFFPVSERREARDESCSDMLAKVALNVLENARLDGFNVSPRDLDSIRVSITPGDYLEPSTASVVHGRIGASDRCPAYDVKMSCAGWLAGVHDALGDLAVGARYCLVLAGMRMGNIRTREPRNRAIFGDGAAGALLGNSEHENFKAIQLWTFGKFARDIVLPHQETTDLERLETFYMADGTKLYSILMRKLPELEEVFEGVDKDSIDHIIVHKPSPGIHRGVEEYFQNLGFPKTKIIQNFDKYGNTVSADLPIALDDCIKQKRIKRGDRILLFSYGAGISAGAAIVDY